MADDSHLDDKYFLGVDTYNCPFCNRRQVTYENLGSVRFNWSNNKWCAIWRVECNSCKKISMHMTFDELRDKFYGYDFFSKDSDLDQAFFYSVPTSFFVVDKRIPSKIRALITEAEGCCKMNYLTGASACTRKAIYELLLLQNTTGNNYDEKIKSLQSKHPNIEYELFEILRHIKDMTSDHVHEESWVVWSRDDLSLFLTNLKIMLHEIYVVPVEKKNRIQTVRSLKKV